MQHCASTKARPKMLVRSSRRTRAGRRVWALCDRVGRLTWVRRFEAEVGGCPRLRGEAGGDESTAATKALFAKRFNHSLHSAQ